MKELAKKEAERIIEMFSQYVPFEFENYKECAKLHIDGIMNEWETLREYNESNSVMRRFCSKDFIIGKKSSNN